MNKLRKGLWVFVLLLAVTFLVLLFTSCSRKFYTPTPEMHLVMVILQERGIYFDPRDENGVEEIINETGLPLEELSSDVELLIKNDRGVMFKINRNTPAFDIWLQRVGQRHQPVKIYIVPLDLKKEKD